MTILGRSEELVSRCVECDLAEPESLSSLGGSAPGVVDGILSRPTGPVSEKDKQKVVFHPTTTRGNNRKSSSSSTAGGGTDLNLLYSLYNIIIILNIKCQANTGGWGNSY